MQHGSESQGRSENEHETARLRRRWPWLLSANLLMAAVAAMLACSSGTSTAPAKALTGKFFVLVRPADRTLEPIPVEEPGALPARDGGAMCLEVQLDEPAFVYLVWLDCRGKVVPLYPWNNERLEITDVDQPPPERRASKRIFSPLLGNAWTFGQCQGMETVLLLARRTPLPAETQLGSLFEDLPALHRARLPKELVVLSMDGGSKEVQTLVSDSRGDEAEAKAADASLKALMTKLGSQFELVRAVRFAHQAEAP